MASHFSADTKHHILLDYAAHDAARSFAALAARHAGGARTVQRWHCRWDRTPQSLERRSGSGKARTLTAAEVRRHIRAPILAANRAHRAISYTDLLSEVQRKTGKELSLRSLRRYGKEQLGARDKHSKKRTADEMSPGLCDQIASMRRKLQRISTSRILFLDETALRLNAAPNHTLVLPGEQPFIEATDTSSYAARYDMIAVCTGVETLLPKVFTPAERKGAAVRGVNSAMLQQFIDDTLAQAVEGLDRYPLTLVLDQASIHKNVDAIRQAFHDRGSQSIKDILLMPPNAAKRVSPLDNALVHDWKELCRKRCPATNRTIQRVMADAWNKLPARLLHAHYKHCGLVRGQDPYFDCPDPAGHKHGS